MTDVTRSRRDESHIARTEGMIRKPGILGGLNKKNVFKSITHLYDLLIDLDLPSVQIYHMGN
jgi:hypothetical protein